MTGRQLREALRVLGYTQVEFAKIAQRTQKAVSLWVTGSSDVPTDVAELVDDLIRTKAPDALLQIAQPPIESEVHSWPQGLFDFLWQDAEKRKRCKQITVEATITESESAPGFADCKILMHFHELELGPNERLYLDHLALPSETDHRGTEWAPPRLLRPPEERTRLTIDEDVPRQAVGYELSNADRLDQVTVELNAKRGVRLSEFDAVGFPLYGDLVVERLAIQANFLGLRPEPDPPTAQTYLIRRTAFRSRPSGLTSDLEPPVREPKASGVQYSFGPLLRPRSGYGYCLSWAKLSIDKAERNGTQRTETQ